MSRDERGRTARLYWAVQADKPAPSALAEGVGFEPTLRLPVNTLSKRAPSATRPPLRLRQAELGGTIVAIGGRARRGRCGRWWLRPIAGSRGSDHLCSGAAGPKVGLMIRFVVRLAGL